MKRPHLNLSLTSVIVLIAVGVMLPVMLSTAVGIVAIVLAQDAGGIVLGVLVISFTVTAAGCAVVAVSLAGSKARLARRQADFVASVSHELRTPLSAIRLYAQTLQSGRVADDREQTARCLATIMRETEWLDVMLEQVLTWRASSRAMLRLELEPGPVRKAVNSAVERFRTMVDPRELQFSADVSTQLPVRHDMRALTSVVLNLLTNAYKYTGREKRIELTARDDGERVLIEVRDNGVGLAPSEAKRVFEPFYRATNRSSGESGGAGLGLAIARYLVRRHGGRIGVSSKEGRGATFSIALPAEISRRSA
jgi:two-component system phosphate regulon sensor histidine kinase PhoR